MSLQVRVIIRDPIGNVITDTPVAVDGGRLNLNFGSSLGGTIVGKIEIRPAMPPKTYGADEHPCSRGRCPDPEAHAEGGHDL